MAHGSSCPPPSVMQSENAHGDIQLAIKFDLIFLVLHICELAVPRDVKEIVSIEQSLKSSEGEAGTAGTWEGTGQGVPPSAKQ